ncbi:uncharacterized protein N7482_005488 [Penicillium canariense]|uniref:Uncharacterized protein n=1 Tax=Penicillium canariense TaxID=189055 RepID=A0A9W9LML4_9EURO|nr:uncharacterized protein N7482_005488 [Penicillium canariense]KAJ5166707.1 hypothetical protein N7482_005488 [Penicillium canariense]
MNATGLQCIICPGQPAFSDVSHLLTHVASKAHLSHYFKLQVRSHQEADAAGLLQTYNDWFNANNLAQLLSDRISSKDDRKKKRNSSRKATVDFTVQRIPRASVSEDLVDPAADLNAVLHGFLDPRLEDSYQDVKYESETEDATFISCYDTPATSTAIDALPIPKSDFDVRSAHSTGKTEMTSWRDQTVVGSGQNANANVALPITPKPTRTRQRPSGTCLHLGTNTLNAFVDGEVDKDRAEEMARLKGVLWPGMDIFDSATQQMRRKRNQKKDGNVLKQMEMTSQLVEPTELIFSPTGILRKERVISGNVEDDSPLKGETPIPKKRPPRPKRGVLRQNDPNVLRAKDRKRVKKCVAPSRHKSEEAPASPGSALILNRKINLGVGDDGEDDELSLSMQAFGKRPRSGFSIFNDEDNQDQQALMQHGANPPASPDTLTPTRLVLNNQANISHNHGHKFDSSLDKENIEPILNSRGRIDPPIWDSTSPFLKRSDSDNSGFAPRYFFDEHSHVGLGMSNDQEKSGYRSNPLLAPTSKMAMYEHNSYDKDVTLTNSGWTAMSRAMSSDATISEEDHNELTRLYLSATAAD